MKNNPLPVLNRPQTVAHLSHESTGDRLLCICRATVRRLPGGYHLLARQSWATWEQVRASVRLCPKCGSESQHRDAWEAERKYRAEAPGLLSEAARKIAEAA